MYTNLNFGVRDSGLNVLESYNYCCVFGKHKYRVLVLCVRPCLFVCVILHDNSKRKRSRNMKLEYIFIHENGSVKFDIIQIMPGSRVTLRNGKPSRSMSPSATLTSRVCHSSRSPEGPGIICMISNLTEPFG